MSTPTSFTRWSGARWALSLIAFLMLALPAGVFAQGSDQIENSAGTTYVVAFPDTTMNTFDQRYPDRRFDDKAYIFIYSAVENTASIRGRGYQRNAMMLKAGGFTVIDLMGTGSEARAPQPIVTDHCKPVDNTFRIESEQPIVVYQYMVTKFGAEAWTAIPVEAWGNEYYAAATPGEIGSDVSPGGEFDYNRKNKMFPAEILVMAAYDDTKITIVPNALVMNFCNTTNITLKAGEAFQIQATVDTLTANVGIEQGDLAGSRIFSTKPVGVISGHTRAQTIDENVGLGKNIFKNMLIEWVAPVEQHGTEFVYTPSWDARRPTGAPQEDPSEKRKAEFVRVYGTHEGETQGFFMQSGIAIPYDQSIEQGKFNETRHSPVLARVHKTDIPSQAMMHSAAVVKYGGTTNGFGGYIGAAYDGWGGYMVELTPREQWMEFAPYYASTHPAGMEHFINVVVDTAHRYDVYMKNGGNFLFQRIIEGTDLIWGSMAVQPGIDQTLEGRNGAKFSGWVYGTYAKGGHEEYRPGRTKGQDENPPDGIKLGSNTDDAPEVLHPSEYEEGLAVAYAYPLAPSRLVVGPGDSLGIKTELDCQGMTINIESLNENPVGLRSIRLDASINTKIKSTEPFPITGAVKAKVRIEPIDPFKDASATVVIKDKTGKITRVSFQYFAEKVTLNPALLVNFGLMTPGNPADSVVTVTNPLGRAVVVKNIRLINQNVAFTIKSPTSFPITIPAGGTINVTVTANPPAPDQAYIDTLEIELECTKWKLPVTAETSNPCVNIHDLNFEVLAVGESKTLPLRICNDGGGEVRFNNPTGGDVLEWLQRRFTVAPADLLRIENAVLGRGDCIQINVTFSSQEIGNFVDTARLWASTRRCRDISEWRALVTTPGPQLTPYDWKQQWIVDGVCHPTESPRGTKNTATEYVSRINTYNTGTADFFVASIELVGPDAAAGHFKFGTTEQILIGDKIRPAAPGDTHRIYQTVIFTPGPAERIYQCEVILVSTDGDTARSILRGEGIESHVQAPPIDDHGRHLFVAGSTSSPTSVFIRTDGTRDVTITDVQIVPDNAPSAGQFTITNVASVIGTHRKNDAIQVDIMYAPTAPGNHSATLLVAGDFSPCDDSTVAVIGKAYTLSSKPHDVAFGTILTCFDSTGQVYVENDGSDPVSLHGITQNGAAEFSVTLPTFPVIIPAGERYAVDITFAPVDPITYTGSVTFDVRDEAGVVPVLNNGNPIVANFTGTGAEVKLNAHIARTYSGLPGAQYDVEVMVDNSQPGARIDTLVFSLRYAHGMMQDRIDPNKLQELVRGTILEGWTVYMSTPPAVDSKNDTMTVIYLEFRAPAGQYLQGTGAAIRIPFVTFIGDKTMSELPFFLTPDSRLACAEILGSPGFAKLDDICGLDFRLISAFDQTYALNQNNPNPFNPSTEINFSLGLDGDTKVSVYDANGKQVAVLVNAYLNPGRYAVTWDASAMPSGLYYCRIVSGVWSKTQTMMLQK